MDGGGTRCRPPIVFWAPLVFCGGVLFLVDFYQNGYQFDFNMIPQYSMYHPIFSEGYPEEIKLKGFLIKTSGCRIPEMDPFDPLVKKFIANPKEPIICNNNLPPLVESNLTSLYILNSSLSAYLVDELDSFKCCYSYFTRKHPKKGENDNSVWKSPECLEFTNSTLVEKEFVIVKCFSNGTQIYKDFFSFVPPKFQNDKKQLNEQYPPLSVLMIGLDAVSRVNLHRQMPKTVNVLKNELNAFELLGYNKVGDNTFPNLIPILTGLSEQELSQACWPHTTSRFDSCPFIWKKFSKKDYVTSYAEDASWMGVFNYQRQGFKEQPTDYYWRTFSYTAANEIGNNHMMNVDMCVGARPEYKTFLEYIRKFVDSMNIYRKPYFSFFWSASLTHDFLNFPHIGDEDYANFFSYLHQNRGLDRTVLIFLSDHGIRWGGIRTTKQGMLEERLPFVFIVLPQWYKKDFPKLSSNLRKNTRRLTTPFDLHETLKDLLEPYKLNSEFLIKREKNIHTSRSYSIFDSIPENRTCDSAHISSHWCTCQESITIENNVTIVKEAAEFSVNYINKMLSGYAECQNLTLKEILNARVHFNGKHVEEENNIRDFTINFVTVPGEAIFEVTVRQKFLKKDVHNNIPYTLRVMGTISRLNLYGRQSACISDFHLKLYCYCKT